MDDKPRGGGGRGANVDPSNMSLDVALPGFKDGLVGANLICGKTVRGARVLVAVEDGSEEGICFPRCFGDIDKARGVGAPGTGA